MIKKILTNLHFSWQAILILLALVLMNGTNSLLAQSKIYWLDAGIGTVNRANLDGSNREEIYIAGEGSSLTDIVIDTAQNFIYWTDTGVNGIFRDDLNGGSPTFFSGIFGTAVEGLAIDLTRERLMWSEFAGEGVAIYEFDLDGLNEPINLLGGLGSAPDVAYSPITDRIYWTDIELGLVQSANADGSGVNTLLTGLDAPNGIAVDGAGGKIYWTEVGFIRRANLDGSEVEDLVNTEALFGDALWITLDLDAGQMYWTLLGEANKIQRANLDGSNVEDLITTGLGIPTGIALYKDNTLANVAFSSVPVAATGIAPGSMNNLLYQVQITSDKAATLNEINVTTGGNFQSDDLGLAGIQVWVNPVDDFSTATPIGFSNEVGSGEVIEFTNLDEEVDTELNIWYTVDVSPTASETDTFTIEAPSTTDFGFDDPIVVTSSEFDPGSNRPVAELINDSPNVQVYWTDFGNRVVQRITLDGVSSPETLVDQGKDILETPVDIEIDPIRGKLYWLEQGIPVEANLKAIRSADLNGDNITNIFQGGIPDIQTPRGIALDWHKGVIYWTDQNTSIQAISKINTDGTGREIVINNLNGPKGIDLDLEAGKMYWIEDDKISRANLDGTNVEALITDPTILSGPRGIAIDPIAGKIFWSDLTDNIIYTADTLGRNVSKLVDTDFIFLDGTLGKLDHPAGIAVDIVNQQVYWADQGNDDQVNRVQRASYDGTSTGRVENVATGLNEPFGLALGLKGQVIINSIPVEATNIELGAVDQPLYKGTIQVINAPVALDQVTFNLIGDFTNDDFQTDGFKLWVGPSDTIADAELVAQLSSIDPNGVLIFTGFQRLFNANTLDFFWVTADIANNTQSNGNSIQVLAPELDEFVFSNADNNTSGNLRDGNIQIIGQTPLTPPSDFNLTVTPSASVILTWTDNNISETNYRILRKFSVNGVFRTLIELGADTTTFEDISVTPGLTYFYRVQAINEDLCDQVCQETCINCSEVLGVVTGVPTALENPLLEQSTSVFPNPSPGDFQFNMDNNYQGALMIKIFNQEGRLISNQVLQKSERLLEMPLDLSHQPAGNFTVFVKSEQGYTIKRIIKSK